jgi:hypothetical protein
MIHIIKNYFPLIAADLSGFLPCQYSSLPFAIETFDRAMEDVVTVRSTFKFDIE